MMIHEQLHVCVITDVRTSIDTSSMTSSYQLYFTDQMLILLVEVLGVVNVLLE